MYQKTFHNIFISLLFLAAANAYSAKVDAYRQNLVQHAKCGHFMDKYYYDAGTTVDIIRYDLDSLKKQGVNVPDSLLKKAQSANRQLRQKWLGLEKRRREIFKYLYLPKPVSDYLVCIENLENMPAVYSGWTGFRSFKIKWDNGKTINLPLSSFLRSAFREKYSYNCEPSNAIFIYGKQSERHTTVTNILPRKIPKGNAKLIISGLDCDKGGRPAKIAIYVFGTKIYSGANPFRKNGWTEHVFEIPANAFQKRNRSAQQRNDIHKKLMALEHEVTMFGKKSDAIAKSIKTAAAPWLAQLKTSVPFTPAYNWWTKKYIRSLDIGNRLYRANAFKHPGNYMNMEYVAKACKALGVNLVTLEIYHPKSESDMYRITRAFAENATYPFLLWGSNQFFLDNDMISFKYYGKRKRLGQDMSRFIRKFEKLPNFAGIQVDEPVIEAHNRRYGKLLDNQEVVKAYRKYIEKRKAVLQENGVKNIPNYPFASKPKTAEQQALWMEWQYFKMSYMAEHFKWLFDMISGKKLMPSIVIMNKNRREPQSCSYVSMGRALPYIGTDLYANGDISESFAIQLLKSTASGQAIMWPGAGYSCKSPETFRRTLATGLAHADGIHVWTYVFCSKYRDANYFWRFGGTRPNRDDKGRQPLNNWHPDFWYILKDMYHLAQKTEPVLLGRKSLAQAAVLVSERTLIANIPERKTIQYWQNCLNIYSDLIQAGVPLDACFVEALNMERLNRYKYLVLSDATSITPSEIAMLTKWVKDGGTLIATGNTSARDQWGRNLPKPSMGYLWGKKSLPKALNKGTVYYIAANNIGQRSERIPDCGLTGKGNEKTKSFLTKLLKSTSSGTKIVLHGLPEGVEYQLQQNGNVYIVNLINWFEKRTIKGHSLSINISGKWSIESPALNSKSKQFTSAKRIKLPDFKIHQMLIIRKAK